MELDMVILCLTGREFFSKIYLMFKKVKEKMGNFTRDMKSVFKSTQMRILKNTINENKN